MRRCRSRQDQFWKKSTLRIPNFTGNGEVRRRTANDGGDSWWGGPQQDDLLSPPRSARVEILANLQKLLSFKPGSRITIHLCASLGSMNVFEELVYLCDLILLMMFPTLQRLKDNGYKVAIVLTENAAPWYKFRKIRGQ